MSVLSDVMLWAMRVNGRKGAPAHQVLEVKADATLEEVQAAFHKIARIAHPDLHRTKLPPDDLETVTLAYARAAAAYQEIRSLRMQTTRIRPIGATSAAGAAGGPAPAPAAAAGSPPGSANAATAMSSKALIYYRKAELSLRRGDLRGAILQLKMAIAADPQSAFLRTALAEVEAEVQKAT